ncbi:phage tail protein [Paenibacillus sp. HJGM_3]|uniref:phage tail protein n=1 Tax=Paenibacillus sp. HJGM_3 TaxID=3379816 RepID=UPI003859545E
MPDPYIGEIRIFGFNFAPDGWALCDGQLLPISSNTALFSLLGTQYGGNGTTHFALPDLRGRVPIGQGGGFVVGQSGGEPTHTLSVPELPSHSHDAMGSTDGANSALPVNRTWALANNLAYHETVNAPMNPAAIASVGGNQPHNNMQPFLTLNFCIALEGSFPPRP